MKRSGFTLIELSIVLVIIGLIIGGVLVGRDLIEAAQNRSQVSQVSKIATAVNAFKLKYNCYPGDCPNAVEQGLTGSLAGQDKNGNGNGKLSENNHPAGGLWSWQENVENANFFYHLYLAGLVDFPSAGYQDAFQDNPDHLAHYKEIYYNLKSNPSRGVLMPDYLPATLSGSDPQYRFMGNALVAFTGATTGTSDLLPVYTAQSAIYIDNKIDDGKPLSGKVGCSYLWGGAIGNPDPAGVFPCYAYDFVNSVMYVSNTNNDQYNTSYGNAVSVSLIFGGLF